MSDDETLTPPSVRVRVHPGLCEGWGECHRGAPELYPLDADGRVDIHVMDVPSEFAEDAWWAASACPLQAITVIGPPREYWFARMAARRSEERRQRTEQDRQTLKET